MFALVIFLTLRPLGGHHAMLYGIRASFEALPLLSVGIDQSVFDLILGLFQACTALSLQLAAPMLVTMLIVDLALGFISKTIPQLNVMTAGLTIRAGVGMLVVRRGPNAGSRYVLDAELTALGRHPDSDVFLDDITVSRRHATVRRIDEGYEVVDVGSLNGTYVDHQRVDQAPLHHLADLQIGRFVLLFLLGGQPA